MKALVTYFSQTGNTEKVARAIYDSIAIAKEILPVQDVKDAGGYDIIFVGFPVQAHSVPGKVHGLLKNLPAGQKVAFFCTHGSLRGGPLPKQAIEGAVGMVPKAKVLGTFGCRGKVSEQILSMLMEKPEHRQWAEEAAGAAGNPDEADLSDARTFAASIMAKLG